jgi:hypothetical protein
MEGCGRLTTPPSRAAGHYTKRQQTRLVPNRYRLDECAGGKYTVSLRATRLTMHLGANRIAIPVLNIASVGGGSCENVTTCVQTVWRSLLITTDVFTS